MPVPALTEQTLARFAGSLAARDPDLARIIKQYGPPPLWARPATFSTLIKIILEQQVSLSSAAAIFGRLRKGVVPFRPERFIELGRERIAACGLTRQKTDYCLHLSEAIVTRQIRLARLKSMSDDDAKATLLRLKGIGSWSADVYLLMALLRPDVWPAGDLALAVAVRDLKDLKSTPTAAELFDLAEQWRPFRSVAARMLWQFYLGQRGVKA